VNLFVYLDKYNVKKETERERDSSLENYLASKVAGYNSDQIT